MAASKGLAIKKNDTVLVIAGREKGKRGKVLFVIPARERVVVEHLNMVKRHQRPRSLKDTQRGGKVGGVIEKEGPIHISNVMLIDPKDKKPTRVGVSREGSARTRVTRRSGTKLD